MFKIKVLPIIKSEEKITVMNRINEKWKNEELIGIDCLMKANDLVIILKTLSIEYEGEKHFSATPLCETTISSLESFNEDIWSAVMSFTEKVSYKDQLFFCGGEGGMGNEGFIVCSNIQDEFVWGLFFENSNPFHRIEIIDEVLIAYSSLNLKYEIDIFHPEKINISPHTLN